MSRLLTPKQVARALDVSESSIKRWCDRGLVKTLYTAGRHRRIALADLLAFVRSGKHALVYPEALGLPPTSGQTPRVVERARERLVESLLAGDADLSRQIAIDLFLAGHALSEICDELFAAAFRQIGEQWACGDAEVYQERRGCEITLRILFELESFLQEVPTSAPRAIGGAAVGDQYTLGTTMAELVLRECGFNATSLGDNLPFATLSAAIETHQPALFWLSCSFIADEAAFLDGYRQLFEQHAKKTAFVIGGYALDDRLRKQLKFAACCDNMQQLETFARTLLNAARD